MCKFFSFVGDGYGNYLYSDWSIRRDIIDNKGDVDPDSHTYILTNNKIPPKLQYRWSKYEFNPLTKEFTVDEGVEGHDHEAAQNWAEHLDFKQIVPFLVIKSVVNPLQNKIIKPTKDDVELLKEYASVGDSVGDSVWDSVRASIWDSIWDSVRASVGASIWDSVRASVGAYCSSFFNIKFDFDFSPATKLWDRGFIPSFDGTTWRLHSGKNAEIVYEMKIK